MVMMLVTDDIDSLDAAFVPGTGWPEPGGLLPREAHKLVGGVAKEGLCGMELVEVRSAPRVHLRTLVGRVLFE